MVYGITLIKAVICVLFTNNNKNSSCNILEIDDSRI